MDNQETQEQNLSIPDVILWLGIAIGIIGLLFGY
jgi:hypothetical protein